MECVVCGKELGRGLKKFCSRECKALFERRADRPSSDELSKMVWEKPTIEIAELYGVSDSAVGKWCRKYGIKKPPRGYWAVDKADRNTMRAELEDPPELSSSRVRPMGYRMFTPSQIIAIRESRESSVRLAAKLGCNHSTISDIRSYKTYKDVV